MAYGAIIVNVFVTLLFTPFLVRSLGKEGYGLVSLAIAFLSYLNILDFGINDSLLRFFVRYRNDRKAAQGFLSRMMSIYVFIGVLIVVLGIALSKLFPFLFSSKMSLGEVGELQEMIVIMAVGASVQIGLNPIAALAYAHEKHFFMKLLESITLLGTTLVTVFFLIMEFGPFSVVAIAAIGKVIQGVCRVAYVQKSIGVKLKLASVDNRELRQVIAYASPIFLSIVAGAIFWKFDSILIGSMVGLAPVAVYSIGVTFNKYFISSATALSRVMTPKIIDQLDGGASPQVITNEMIRISRIQALILLLILSGLVVYGKRFLNLWLGAEFDQSYWIMLFILVPYTLELTGNSRNVVLQVKQLYWHKTAITFSMALLNIPLTILFLKMWGVLGAAASTGSAILAGYLMISMLLKSRVGFELGRYWMQTSRGILPIAALLTIGGLSLEPRLADGWVWLLIGASVYTFVYVLTMYWFAMDGTEREFVMRYVGRFARSDRTA